MKTTSPAAPATSSSSSNAWDENDAHTSHFPDKENDERAVLWVGSSSGRDDDHIDNTSEYVDITDIIYQYLDRG